MAAQRSQVYQCSVCGNVVELLHVGSGTLVCCGVPMRLLSENTTDAAEEEHVPVVDHSQRGLLVKVGSVAHPMEQKHLIEGIQVAADGRSCRQFFRPGDLPEAQFPMEADGPVARAFCNVHGLWKGELRPS